MIKKIQKGNFQRSIRLVIIILIIAQNQQYRTMSLVRHKIKSSTSIIYNQSFEQRQWLKRRGKDSMLRFSDDMIKKLQVYFQSLDDDGNRMISLEQLEDPLILFGACSNKQQVRRIFQAIDVDNSGELSFVEFLEVFRKVKSINNPVKPCKKKKQTRMYQQFTNTLLGMQNEIKSEIPFRLGMSIYRRKHLMNAIVSKNSQQKSSGKQIMKKFQSQIKQNPIFKDRLKTEKSSFGELPEIYTKKQNTVVVHKRIKTTN